MHPLPVTTTFSGDLKRSRLSVFFRPLLAIPHILWLFLWAVPASFVFVGHWFVAVFTGRTTQGTHDFLVRYLQYSSRVVAYQLYLTNGFPPFNGTDPYEYTLHIAQPVGLRQGRASSFFRYLLATPALMVSFGATLGLYVVAVVAWWAIMFTGRMPAGMQRFCEPVLGYNEQLNAYLYLLTRSYPTMSAGSVHFDAVDPITPVLAPAVPQAVGSPFV